VRLCTRSLENKRLLYVMAVAAGLADVVDRRMYRRCSTTRSTKREHESLERYSGCRAATNEPIPATASGGGDDATGD
jgi:hypothetical protein